jgi:hypothetical protein
MEPSGARAAAAAAATGERVVGMESRNQQHGCSC